MKETLHNYIKHANIFVFICNVKKTLAGEDDPNCSLVARILMENQLFILQKKLNERNSFNNLG